VSARGERLLHATQFERPMYFHETRRFFKRSIKAQHRVACHFEHGLLECVLDLAAIGGGEYVRMNFAVHNRAIHLDAQWVNFDRQPVSGT